MFYDGLSRLIAADYSVGADYTYGYDVAGNLVNNNGVTSTYNAANQMTNDGTNALTYDNNGNLTNDGVNSFTWDRANRMLTAPGSTSYKYDGAGNRIAQTISGVVSAYLNDVQPGLTQLLAETVSGNTTRYVQGVRGIHATESHAGVWSYFVQDGLDSVRGIVDNVAALVSSQSFNPIGVPTTDYGKGFGFTGEYTDANDLLYLRARYYAPSKGVFTALDPFEGFVDEPMSINGYSYVHGNPVNWTDPSGEICLLALIVGGAIIGFISGGAYDAFANQGFGSGGANDIFNRSLDGSRDAFNNEQFLVYGTGGTVIGIITVVHPVGLGATSNIAGSALSGNYQGLSDSEAILRLTTDATIGGAGGYFWNAGVSQIPLSSGRAFFQRAVIAGGVNTGQGIVTRITDNALFYGDNDVFAPSSVGTDFVWGFGVSSAWDTFAWIGTGGGITRFGPRSQGDPIVRLTTRNPYGVHTVNPAYRALNIGNYQSEPGFVVASGVLGTNLLPPVWSNVGMNFSNTSNFPEITIQDAESMGLVPPDISGVSLIEGLGIQQVTVCDAAGPISYRQLPDMSWIMQIGCEAP